MRHLSLTLAGGFGALLAVAGCSANYDNTGYVSRPDAMSQLKPGVVTREDVQRLLGTPSSVAAFDDKTWYYIGEKTEQVAASRQSRPLQRQSRPRQLGQPPRPRRLIAAPGSMPRMPGAFRASG